MLLDTSHPIMFLILNASPINHDVQLVTCKATTAAKSLEIGPQRRQHKRDDNEMLALSAPWMLDFHSPFL